MATERVVIIVSENGAATVVKRLTEVGEAAKTSGNSVDYLRNVLGLLGAAATLKGLFSMLDTFQNMENRLKLVTKSSEEAAFAQRELFEVANRSRSSIEQTSELFNRLALSTTQLGLSNAEVARTVETLNKATILSGASAKEANAALIQLSQGFASGMLRGQEMRSVLEQIPLVADIISKKMGVTRGALRELGSQGKVSAKVMVDALLAASGDIDAKFSKTFPTIGQQVTVLKNQLLIFIGDLNARFQILPKITAMIKFFGDNMETIGRVVLAGVLVSGLVKAMNAWNAFNLVVAMNPLGAVLFALTAGIALLITFSDELKLAADGQATLADFGSALWDEMKDAINGFSIVFEDAINFWRDAFKQVFGEDFEFSIKGVLKAAALVRDKLVGLFIGAKDAIVVAWKSLPASLELIFVALINASITQIEFFINSFISGLNQLLDNPIARKAGLDPLQAIGIDRLKASKEAEDTGKAIADAFTKGLDSQTAGRDMVDRLLIKAEEKAKERIKRQQEAEARIKSGRADFGTAKTPDELKAQKDIFLDETIQRLKDEGDALGYVGTQRAANLELIRIEQQMRRKGIVLTGEERAGLLVQIQEVENLKLKSHVVEEVAGRQERYAQTQKILNDLIAQGTELQDKYIDKLVELKIKMLEDNKDMASGFQRGFLKTYQEISDFSKLTENLVTNAFGNMEDALVAFVKTGKLDFHSLVDSMLADLTRLIFRQAVLGIFNAATGGIGGLLGAATGARAGGGSVTPGKSYLVGERGPELFTPASSGNITPNEAMGGSPQVNVSVVNVTSEDEIFAAMNSSRGEEIIVNKIGRNKNRIKQVIG